MKTSRLIISDVVYSELASQFSKEELLTSFMDDLSNFITNANKRF
jgi:hypothetical protein